MTLRTVEVTGRGRGSEQAHFDVPVVGAAELHLTDDLFRCTFTDEYA